MQAQITRAISSDAEYVKSFLLHMNAYRWTKASKRMEVALLYLIESGGPDNIQVKAIYAEVASRMHCSWNAVERSLRYALNSLWQNRQADCSRLFYREMTRCECPTVSDFLYIFYSAYKRGVISSFVDSIEKQNYDFLTK